MGNYSWASAFIAQFDITSHCIQQDNNQYIISISPYGQAIGSNLKKIHCIITKPDWFVMICDSRSVPTSTLCPVTIRLWSRIDTHCAPWMTMSRCHETYWHPIIRELEDNQIIQYHLLIYCNKNRPMIFALYPEIIASYVPVNEITVLYYSFDQLSLIICVRLPLHNIQYDRAVYLQCYKSTFILIRFDI